MQEKDYAINPMAELFPAMDNESLQQLASDIEHNGLQEPGQLDAEGRILDGRNRYLACQLVRNRIKEFKVRKWPKDRPATFAAYWEFVWSRNAQRRHLSKAQIAQIAVAGADALKGRGKPPKTDIKCPFTQVSDTTAVTETTRKELAKAAGVSESSIAKATRIHANPEAEKAVIAGSAKASKVLKKSTPDPLPDPTDKDQPGDVFGNALPEAVADAFERVYEIRCQITALRTIKREIKEAIGQQRPVWAFVAPHLQRLESDLDNVVTALKFAIPYALCPYCGGDTARGINKCKACRLTGFLPKQVHDRQPPECRWDKGAGAK